MTYETSTKEVSECTDLVHSEKGKCRMIFGRQEIEEKGKKSQLDYSLPAYITSANLRNPNDPSLPSFLEACKAGDRELVKNLAQTRDGTDDSLTLGLTKAAEADNVAVVLYLLESGVRWDAYTLQRAKSIEVFEALFNHGFTMNGNLPQSSILLTYVGYPSFLYP